MRALQVALVVKNPPASAGDIMRPGFNPWVRKIPWRFKIKISKDPVSIIHRL